MLTGKEQFFWKGRDNKDERDKGLCFILCSNVNIKPCSFPQYSYSALKLLRASAVPRPQRLTKRRTNISLTIVCKR